MPAEQSQTLAAAQAAAAVVADAVEREEGPMTPNKRRIVEAAILAFAEKGYAATSTKAIAVEAGVSEAAIFRHFPTKKDLLLRLLQPFARHVVVASGLEELSVALAQSADMEELIRHMMRNRLALVRQFAPVVRIMVQELPFQPELQAALAAQLPHIRANIEHVLGSELAAGRIRPMQIDRMMRWVASLFLGYFLFSTHMPRRDGWDDEAEIAEMAAFVARGVAP